MRSLQNENPPEEGAVSLKKVFQFLHQVSAVEAVCRHRRLDIGIGAFQAAGITSWVLV